MKKKENKCLNCKHLPNLIIDGECSGCEKVMTPLEALERHKKSIDDLLDNGTILPELHYVFMKELNIIENALKERENLIEKNSLLETINIRHSQILKIIKEKEVDVYILLKTKTLDEYNKWYDFAQDDFKPLTKNEFILLKVWLK